ncbi:MAG: MmgE/PrpD family protein [Fimbriimonadaceae bacterium]|nr:MmgE/PrpD family protein [Fimbriimonadaceae bacterium]
MSRAEQIAAYATGLPYSELTHEAVHATKDRIVDTIGAMLAGWLSEPAKIARDYASLHVSPTGASVVGVRGMYTPEVTAFANAIQLTASNLGDATPDGEFSPCEVVPPLLALAEALGTKGEDLILGLVVGYDIAGVTQDLFASGVAGAGAMLARSQEEVMLALTFPTVAGLTAMNAPCTSRDVVMATMLAAMGLGVDDAEDDGVDLAMSDRGASHWVEQALYTGPDGEMVLLNSDEIAEKFVTLSGELLRDQQVTNFFELMAHLDELEDIGMLMECLVV